MIMQQLSITFKNQVKLRDQTPELNYFVSLYFSFMSKMLFQNIIQVNLNYINIIKMETIINFA